MLLFTGSAQPTVIGRVLGIATGVSRQSLLESTNMVRARSGSQKLQLSRELNTAAQAKAEDMVEKRYWSHETPNGDQPWVFIDQSGYNYSQAGENLAYGFLSSEATISGWMNSQSHRENMLDGDYRDVGFGIANTDSFVSGEPETVIVAFYASPAGSGANQQPTGNFSNVLSQENRVPFIASFSQGNTGLLSFGLGILIGSSAVFLIIRHGLRLKRIISSGEHFIMHHPVLDLSVTAILVVGVLLSQTIGFIL